MGANWAMAVQALFNAIKSGDRESVERLVGDHPSLLGERDETGVTAVQAAAYAFQFDLARWLAAQGATLDLPSACCIGDVETVRRLARTDTVDSLSPDGFTPLSLASAFGGEQTVKALLDAGAAVNLRGTALGGIAPVHAAVFGRNTAGLATLLAAGADPDLRQEGGFTPLMGAAQNGDAASVAALLAAGADRTLENDDGKTAVDFAQEAGHGSLFG